MTGQEEWKKAKKMIPGGTQLLSKQSEMFLPENWPSYYKRAKGVEVEDLDGNTYIDMTIMGVGSCILGYADDDVDNAVRKVISDGSMCTLNSIEDVRLAELLLELHPWADKVRYARTGGEIMAIAVRIARAYSKKEKVAFCGYHGWHDWYLSCNLSDDMNLDGHLLPGLQPAGVPRGLKDTSIPFHYNKIEELEKIVAEHEVGAVILEPVRHQDPENNFLEKVREIASNEKAVMIFDEITCGWRNNAGGMHLLYGVNPDIAVFAKGMSNGYPMAAVVGTAEVMEASQDTFISSTYWTERIGPAAAIAAIKKMRDCKVWERIEQTGKMIAEGWKGQAEKHGLNIEIQKPYSLVSFSFPGDTPLVLKTLFTQEMLKKGYLAGTSVYVSYAHTEKHVETYMEAVEEVFAIIAKSIQNNNSEDLLEGPVCHSGFSRLT